MSGEMLVEKLDEAVCRRVCHPDVTFLENVNCRSCVSSNKEVYYYPTACINFETFFAGFDVLSFSLLGPSSLISLTLSSS